MKKTLLILSLALAALLNAQEASFKNVPYPEGKDIKKNLLTNPDMQPSDEAKGQVAGWNNYSGGKVAVFWTAADGKKILKASSGKPGYHLGLNRMLKDLKPGTEYQLYMIARTKITGPGSKLVFLYAEGQLPGQKKHPFLVTAGSSDKSSDWKLYSCRFRTPAEFKDGKCSVYAALFYGTAEIEIARMGLLETVSAQ